MKVLYLSQYANPFSITGVGSHIHGIAKHIKQDHPDCDIVVIGGNQLRNKQSIHNIDNIKVVGFTALIEKIRIPFVGTLIDGGLSFKPYFLMKKENPDFVHFCCFSSSWLGLLAVFYCLKYKKKLLYTPHYHDIPYYRLHPLYYLNRLIMKFSDCVVADTKMEQKKFEKVFRVPKKKIEIISCGVDNDLLEGDISYNPMILYVGQGREERKGFLRALRLFLELKNEGGIPDFNFCAAGCDIDQQKYFEMIPVSLKNVVKLIGMVSREDLVKLYQTCYCLILPSDYEAFGIVLAEAMICKKPVIAFNVGGVPEVVLDQMTGYLVKDMDEMKEKLLNLTSSIELTKKLGENGYTHVVDSFLWSKSAEKQYDIYCQI